MFSYWRLVSNRNVIRVVRHSGASPKRMFVSGIPFRRLTGVASTRWMLVGAKFDGKSHCHVLLPTFYIYAIFWLSCNAPSCYIINWCVINC